MEMMKDGAPSTLEELERQAGLAFIAAVFQQAAKAETLACDRAKPPPFKQRIGFLPCPRQRWNLGLKLAILPPKRQ